MYTLSKIPSFSYINSVRRCVSLQIHISPRVWCVFTFCRFVLCLHDCLYHNQACLNERQRIIEAEKREEDKREARERSVKAKELHISAVVDKQTRELSTMLAKEIKKQEEAAIQQAQMELTQERVRLSEQQQLSEQRNAAEKR